MVSHNNGITSAVDVAEQTRPDVSPSWESNDLAVMPFSEYLEQQATDMSRPKRDRTRSRFKAGAARILESKGYHGLQMSGVCRDLGLSQGSIYNYFTDKKELALEVMTEFWDKQIELFQSIRASGDILSRLYQRHLEYVRFISRNIGLWRCLRQLADEIPEFTVFWHRKNYGHCLLMARSLQRNTGSDEQSASLFAARALGCMVDEVLHEVFIRKNPEFVDLANSPEELAERISILYYRMAYAVNPEGGVLSEDHPLLDLSLDRKSGDR